MAQVEKPDESTLTAAMRLVTAMMIEHNDFTTLGMDQPPIDCDALRDMINSAQNLLLKFCPILRDPE